MPTTETRYTATAIALHWLLAVAILGSMAVGWYMSDLALSPQKLKLYNWHKWAGVTILLLSVLRLVWRLTHRPPMLPLRIETAMPTWQLRAYHASHHLMYALFLIVPLMGWAYSSMAGFPIVWFGALPLPDFVPVDKELALLLKPVHGWLAYTLLALVAVHVLAALKHHFIDRDGLLARMRPAAPDLRNLPMKTLTTAALAIAAASLLAVHPADAQTAAAKLLPGSEIGFVSKQLGVPVQGNFKKFDAQIAFDPKNAAAGKVSFSIDTASAAIGDPDTDRELAKPEWFGVAKFPQASFQSSSIKALGGGRFEVAGTLAIKGTARDVVVPVTLTQAGGTSTATGSFTIKRLAFGIGAGDWSDTSMVADEVQVKFKLALSGLGPL